jgi:aldehyde dehydrogenase (NAD(P)+)
MTGGIKTHDAIVFGEGETGAERKRRNQPITDKRVTSELGNASPTIIVPGPWTAADIRYQAENIATMVYHNQGFNCVSTQVMVTPGDWSLTPLLLDAVREVIRRTPYRHAYYPGAAKRLERILSHYPATELFDQPADGVIPRAFIGGLDPSCTDDIAFREEFFTTAFAQVSLPGKRPGEFLRHAIDFANQHLLGTLGISLLIHPATIKQLGPALDEALAGLRYGTIGLNTWTGLAYQLSEAPWGAFPGHPLNDAGSGIGVVHNTMLFDKAQKTVVRGPFRPFPRSLFHGEWHISPKPLWFLSNRKAEVIGRRVVYFEANPGPQHIPGIVWAALRG